MGNTIHEAAHPTRGMWQQCDSLISDSDSARLIKITHLHGNKYDGYTWLTEALQGPRPGHPRWATVAWTLFWVKGNPNPAESGKALYNPLNCRCIPGRELLTLLFTWDSSLQDKQPLFPDLFPLTPANDPSLLCAPAPALLLCSYKHHVACVCNFLICGFPIHVLLSLIFTS